jgi:hypothetical protein
MPNLARQPAEGGWFAHIHGVAPEVFDACLAHLLPSVTGSLAVEYGQAVRQSIHRSRDIVVFPAPVTLLAQ